MNVFVEGAGCSLNQSDTEQLRGFLLSNGFSLVEKPERAVLLILTTCAVKEQTESKMLKRIKQLNAIAEKRGLPLVVSGCLPKINKEAVSKISKKIVQVGPSLSELASFLELPLQEFSPNLQEQKSNPAISIMGICRGCLGDCSYCTVKNARGRLRSYSIKELNKKFRQAIKQSKEVWLTAQDCGCYGLDLGGSLPGLLRELLKNKGNFRVRVGMINPGHLKQFLQSYLRLFEDERLYRFFHLPVQSGSDEILSRMNRKYGRRDFLEMAKAIRSRFPNAVIATDVIAGFPGETEAQFGETISLLKQAEPDVVNISRFGSRPNTLAARMPEQLHGRIKKNRSRILTKLCKEIALRRNKRFLGEKQTILVDEEGSKGGFVGRNQGYKPVVVKKGRLGAIVEVEIERAFPNYLLAK